MGATDAELAIPANLTADLAQIRAHPAALGEFERAHQVAPVNLVTRKLPETDMTVELGLSSWARETGPALL